MKKLLPLIVACCLPTGTLASPLVGTWQADATELLTAGCTDFCPEQVTMTATFSEDSQYSLDILFDYEGDLWAFLAEDGTDLSALGLPAMETYEIRVAGTYEDNGSTFAVTVSEHRGLVNRGDPVEFYTKAGRILARALADEAGIPEEDYDAFEARFLEGFLSGIPEATNLDLMAVLAQPSAYQIAGDTMSIFGLAFQRTEDDVTAVARAAWGDIKAHR